MASFAVDTSCMIPALCSWHEHHALAADAIEARLNRGEKLIVPAHALLETYAVLTRFPAPKRLSPSDAWTLVRANFADAARVVSLGPIEHVELLEGLAASGIAGGRSYDALIAACAKEADSLLTFNPKHFEPAPKGVLVVDPSALA